MPRPKVNDTDRQRALQACAPCKASKRRCDCKQPCANCIKRKNTASCVFKNYLPRIPGNASRHKSNSTASSCNTLVRRERQSDDHDVRQQSEAAAAAAARSTTPRRQASRSRHFTDAPPSTSPNMLWTSRGVQVCVGSSASLSFLILLRDMLTKYTATGTFTDASQSSVMLENRNDENIPAECTHGFSLHSNALGVYFAATSGILEAIPDDHISQFIHTQSMPMSNTASAIIHAALAVGFQCQNDAQCEAYHISKARQIAFDALRDDLLNVDLVRVFIIMAFYMFGACRRNTAFMYIGIAARASDALGLRLQPERLHIWKSVRILDLLVAAVLGRSPATMDEMRAVIVAGEHQRTHRFQAVEASFDVWTIVESMVQELYRSGKSDTNLARSFLSDLSKWSNDLPTSLKSDPPQSPVLSHIQQKEYVIGNIHVSCAYYFAVLTTTRKYLISVLYRVLSKSSASQQDCRGPPIRNHSTQNILSTSEPGQLAQACIDSAVLLIQTCKEVSAADMLLPNMCLLKAWIFAAGMIVGFAFFVTPNLHPSLEEVLLDACSVLQFLATSSPQAKQYHDILNTLHRAASEHHQRLDMLTSSQQQAPLVSKIFSYRGQAYEENNNIIYDTAAQSDYGTHMSRSLPNDDLSSSLPIQFDAGESLPSSIEPMDCMAAQFWDDILLLDGQQYQF